MPVYTAVGSNRRISLPDLFHPVGMAAGIQTQFRTSLQARSSGCHQESPSCSPENRPSGTRKNQVSFPFHSGNPTTFSSIFNFQFSDSMTSASVSASKPLLPLFHSAIPSKPYKPSRFLIFLLFFRIEENGLGGLGTGILVRVTEAKKEAGPDEFL